MLNRYTINHPTTLHTQWNPVTHCCLQMSLFNFELKVFLDLPFTTCTIHQISRTKLFQGCCYSHKISRNLLPNFDVTVMSRVRGIFLQKLCSLSRKPQLYLCWTYFFTEIFIVSWVLTSTHIVVYTKLPGNHIIYQCQVKRCRGYAHIYENIEKFVIGTQNKTAFSCDCEILKYLVDN